MGAVGTSPVNVLAESFNATLKRETLQGAHAWPDEATCRREVFGWVNRYNTRRRHSYCGQQAPIVYEQQHALHRGSLANRPPRVHHPGVRPVVSGSAPQAENEHRRYRQPRTLP